MLYSFSPSLFVSSPSPSLAFALNFSLFFSISFFPPFSLIRKHMRLRRRYRFKQRRDSVWMLFGRGLLRGRVTVRYTPRGSLFLSMITIAYLSYVGNVQPCSDLGGVPHSRCLATCSCSLAAIFHHPRSLIDRFHVDHHQWSHAIYERSKSQLAHDSRRRHRQCRSRLQRVLDIAPLCLLPLC